MVRSITITGVAIIFHNHELSPSVHLSMEIGYFFPEIISNIEQLLYKIMIFRNTPILIQESDKYNKKKPNNIEEWISLWKDSFINYSIGYKVESVHLNLLDSSHRRPVVIGLSLVCEL